MTFANIFRSHENDAKTKVWVKRFDEVSFVPYTLFVPYDSTDWYLDSSCSRHMTGNMILFSDFVVASNGFVIFGDGVKKKNPWKR